MCCAQILETVKTLGEQGWEYDLEASYIEVYNEALRDLLAEGKGRDVGKITAANAIKHGASGRAADNGFMLVSPSRLGLHQLSARATR